MPHAPASARDTASASRQSLSEYELRAQAVLRINQIAVIPPRW